MYLTHYWIEHYGMKRTFLTLTISILSFTIISGCSPDPPIEQASNPSTAPEFNESPPEEKDVDQEPLLTPSPEPIPVTIENLKDGWIRLFDGGSFYGWHAENEANWAVEDGTITVSDGSQGLLRTTSEFTDYILQLEFKADKTTNSGIFLRTLGQPTDPTKDCYEFNIAPVDNPFPTGSLVGRTKIENTPTSGEWQTVQITVLDKQIKALVDGNLVLDYTDEKPIPRGFIGLQLNSGKVAFRNIMLRPLSLESIFNGTDLTGWIEYPEMESRFSVTDDGDLNVLNGRGQLETKGHYADFVLQLECISYAEALNSGIFLRCIPGDVMMGYESQIQNGMQDGNPLMPADCGTGGIFRRQDARRIVAKDNEWFHKTIVMSGNHIAVWVNGYQVSDWYDQRKADENPRRGLRTEAGSIMIQGHDPTTNLSFRNLRIAELK
ncbi:MAG: DUF1080 domain-containing protein [Planctomycetota bacterium]|nr:DUF1080 domain-containing protein [Planctomycetota bacterium]